MNKVAFFLYGLKDLKGGGGAERFFADFFERYNNDDETKFKLYFIIDNKSVLSLQEVGRLKISYSVLNFKIYSNRFKINLEFIQLLKYILLYRINIIHIPLYDKSYVPIFKKINKLIKYLRPKLVINIVNCYAAEALSDVKSIYHVEMRNTYFPLFNEVDVDGYFCWNDNFKFYLEGNLNLIKAKPIRVQSITSRFSDTVKFSPVKVKKNWIVFASRLDNQKHPEWLVNAIKLINDADVSFFNNWKVKICGNGPLREELKKYVQDQNLNHIVEFPIQGEMQKILNFSKIYVSCQDFDNFPSLSMAEAMASGNAIIARNLGQTNLFVVNGLNGILIQPDSENGLVMAIKKLVNDFQLTESMGSESIRLMDLVHTYKNFKIQIEDFWLNL
jgi:glycosyltransferase involved in cell wall biosynthesis